MISGVTSKYGVDTQEFDNEVYDAAAQIMKQQEENQPVTSEDINFVISVIVKEAPHDKQSIKQLFLGMLSAFTKLPIHHAISSKDSGAGKSYLLVLVAGYIPRKYIVSLTGMSDKAMLHKAGIVVVEDDDGEPVPLDPLVQKLEDDKENINEELAALPRGMETKEKRNELKQDMAEINEQIKDLKMKAEKLIVLENKIILLLDTTQDNLFNALMSLVSQDTKDDQKYEYVDTSSNSAIGTKSNRFKGTPAIFTCQVVDDSRQVHYAEKNRRFIHVIPDTSSDKIQTAMDQIGLRYGLLPEEYDGQVVSRDDKEKAKVICSRIVKKLILHSQHFQQKDSGIKVLFPKAITRSIVKNPNDVWGMTVADRINKYLAVITKMSMDSRPRFIDNDIPEGRKFYPIAIFDDLKEALELMQLASSTLRPYIVDWYNRVFIPAFDDLDSEPFALRDRSGNVVMKEMHVGVNTHQLGDKTVEVFGGQKPNSEDILKHYLYPLLNLGIIDKVRSGIDSRANIYFPVDASSINTLFTDPSDPRLEITDPIYYPEKKCLEDTCRTIIEYCSKGGGVNERKYRLVDHEGKDITPEELVERYLYNPEVSFKEQNGNSGDKSKNTAPPLACSNILTGFSNNDEEESSNPPELFLSKIHPGILDNSLRVEFVTSKTSTSGIVRFLNRQTIHHGYYYSCYYCYDLTKATFCDIDEYERHIVTVHKAGTVGYPGYPDIEKLELERVRRMQGFKTMEEAR